MLDIGHSEDIRSPYSTYVLQFGTLYYLQQQCSKSLSLTENESLKDDVLSSSLLHILFWTLHGVKIGTCNLFSLLMKVWFLELVKTVNEILIFHSVI